jgi:hypothetical protein
MGGTMTIVQMALILFIFQRALRVPSKPACNPQRSIERNAKGR